MILKMILVFLKIGFFSFGGGWAVVGLLQREMMENGILSLSEFTQAVAIAQVTPGPVAINLATYTGYRHAGLLGAFLNTFFFLLPPILIVLCIVLLSTKVSIDKTRWSAALMGFTTVMVLVTLISLSLPRFLDVWTMILATGVFIGLRKFKINPLWLIFTSGFAGILIFGFLTNF
ncbi:chromate transporter [Pseudothermotoga thermarum]|uniref:Chromate transporter n=1 Tax=Pseudothermotoga thermarum DSM 5069 TaxID=688269 RepID=F7YUU8_9THEM|nr:chromate transporter [Pseudothermotoga thermarum]AEH51508.1 Chromate transporter [Pseudothermotoga thermarum DSM 5069]